MNEQTLLLRQVHPSWVQQGRVSSQAFRPTPKDEKQLSAYDGDQITAAKAWEHYTGILGLSSAGVLAVTMGECEGLSLALKPDPPRFAEHVLIDFTAYSENEIKRKAKQLKTLAESRGWQYRVQNPV